VRIERLEEENAALLAEVEKLREETASLRAASALPENAEAVRRRALEERDAAVREMHASRDAAEAAEKKCSDLQRALGYKLDSPAAYLARLLSRTMTRGRPPE
jgi:predicted RNase H-like nuclease (RuvC/YqgF family)